MLHLSPMMMESRQAEAQPWHEFVAYLKNYVRKRVSGDVVDDVVGDILLKVVGHRDELERAANPLAWLSTIAANTVTDYHRRRAAEQRLLKRIASEPMIDTTELDAHSANALKACVLPFVRRLPSAYAQALTLTDIEGLSQTAAAGRLGLSVSGMKSRIQRGRSKLRDLLMTCCTIELDRRGRVHDVQAPPKTDCQC
jgi:RNA polymerase sigma-70 factor (ECF subfamily)